MRAYEIERAAVYREQHRFRQRPAEPGRREAESRRRWHHDHLARVNRVRQHRANAIVEGVARREHADLPATMMQHLVSGAFERGGPRARRAANKRCGETEMTPSAEHDLGGAD